MCVENWIVTLEGEYSKATISNYSKKVRQAFEWLELRGYQFDNKNAPEEYRNYLKKHYAPKSANLYLSAIKKYDKYYQKKHTERTYWSLEDGIRNAEVIKTKTALNLQELNALIKHARVLQKSKTIQKQRDGLILELLLTRGLRTIEVTRLKKDWLKADDKIPYLLIQGKGKSENKLIDLTIPKRLYTALNKFSKSNDSIFLLPSKTGKEIDTSLIRRLFKKAVLDCLKSSSDTITAHGCRHSLTQLLRKNKVSNDGEHGIKRLLRHSDNSAINAYVGDSGVLERRESTERIELIVDDLLK